MFSFLQLNSGPEGGPNIGQTQVRPPVAKSQLLPHNFLRVKRILLVVMVVMTYATGSMRIAVFVLISYVDGFNADNARVVR